MAFGPDGGRLAFYGKIHLFDAQGFGESTFIKPGPLTDPVVFESGGARFGLMTCYDLRFPELARSLADAGAEVLLVCSSWVPGTHKTEQWLALNAARAIENSVYVAGVCQAPPVSVGRSVLVDPMGVVEADLGLEPGVRAVDVSLETVARVRELFPMFRQRRSGKVFQPAGQTAEPGLSNNALVLLWGTTTWTALRWTVKSAGVVVAISPSRFTGSGCSVTSRTCRVVRWYTRSCSMKLPSLSNRAIFTCSRRGPARIA